MPNPMAVMSKVICINIIFLLKAHQSLHDLRAFLIAMLQGTHICHKFITPVKLVEEHAEAGKAGREEQHIARTRQGHGSIDCLLKIIENTAHRIGNALFARLFLNGWEQLIGAATHHQDYIPAALHNCRGPLFQGEMLDIATSHQHYRAIESLQSHASRYWSRAGTVVDKTHPVDDAHFLQAMGYPTEATHGSCNTLIRDSQQTSSCRCHENIFQIMPTGQRGFGKDKGLYSSRAAREAAAELQTGKPGFARRFLTKTARPGIIVVENGDPFGSLMTENIGFGLGIFLHAAISIEVIGIDIGHHRDLGAERMRSQTFELPA